MDKLIIGGFEIDIVDETIVQLNKSVADVREPGDRDGTWTHDITLPGSPSNRKAFSHLYELDAEITNDTATQFNPDFNPNLKANAQYLVEEVEIIYGFCRLKEIQIIDHDKIEFLVTLHGVESSFWNSITNSLLSELVFTEYNHTLTYTNVSESWATRIQKNGGNYVNFSGGLPIGEGYVYALIDDGTEVNYYGDTNLSQFYPALYKKDIVDHIFASAGFTYTDDSFFNLQDFKNQVIPCPTGMNLSGTSALQREFEATKSSASAVVAGGQLTFPIETFDTGGNYDTTGSAYSSPTSGGVHDFYFYCKAAITGLALNNTSHVVSFDLLVNGVRRVAAQIIQDSNGSGAITIDKTIVFQGIILQAGDLVTMRLFNITVGTPVAFTFSLSIGATFYNKAVGNSWGLNNTVDFASFFDSKSTQKEFLKSIFNEFNLYCEPVLGKTNELFVQTRDDFYDGTTEDWSELLDISQPLDVSPMGELNGNPYYFKHANGDDTINKDYQSNYGRVYGDKKYFVQNDFIKNEKKIELIFAPAQQRQINGFDKVLTYIPLEMDKGTGQLRSLYYGGLKTCNNYTIFDNSNMSGASHVRSDYPFTAHVDDPVTPTVDLLYGMPLKIERPAGTVFTNNNLYNRFWSKYIREITDKNSEIVRGYFDISPATFNKLSFRNIYFFERNYFVLNNVFNYDPKNYNLTQCEFLKLKTGTVFIPETGEGGVDSGGVPFPGQSKPKRINGSDAGRVGMNIGRDNTGIDGLTVGDRVSHSTGARLNTALGSDEIVFNYGVERATVIGSSGIVPLTDEFWVQNAKIDLSGATNTQVLSYDSASNTWIPATASAGSFSYTIHTVAAADSPYTIVDTAGFHVYLVNATAGPVTLKPPAAATITAQYVFKKTDASANAMIIDPNGAELIDGGATASIVVQYSSITTVSDGSNLQII